MDINIAIADDHPLIGEGIRHIFSNYKHLNLHQVYSNGTALLDGLHGFVPDVLILDIQLGDTNGDELIQKVLDLYPQLNVLVFTNFDSPMYAEKMMYLGAKGFLLKTANESSLVTAIETIHTGTSYLERDMAEKIAQLNQRNKRFLTTKTALTLREKQVLQMIVEGFTDAEIASNLFLGLETIKHYRKTLLLKLDAKNTASLVNIALKQGLAK